MSSDHELDGIGLERRRFAGTMAAAAVGMAAAGTSATASPARSRPPSDVYDVVVVGAGFAGLVAARDCAQRGLKVLLLEGRDRIGGRTHDVDFRGSHIEQGGTWIHWVQGYSWGEFSRYGLTIKESPSIASPNASWIAEGKLYHGDASTIVPELQKGLEEFVNVDGQNGRTIFPRPYDNFYNGDLVRKLDGLSLGARMDQAKLSPRVKDLINPLIALGCGNALKEGAFLDWAKWWTLNDFTLENYGTRQGRYKIKEGTGALARAILADSKLEVRLSTAVRIIRHDAQGAQIVDTEGRVYKGRRVICTVPLTVLASIAFDPPLSPGKVRMSRAGGSPNAQKRYILVKEKLDLWNGYAPLPEPVSIGMVEEQRPDGTLLIAFATARYDMTDKAQAQTAIRTLIPGVTVVDTAGYDWRKDPMTNGLWSFYRPGQLTTGWEEMRRPEGVVHFASADSASGWRGFIDGAIERGVETARLVSAELNGGVRSGVGQPA